MKCICPRRVSSRQTIPRPSQLWRFNSETNLGRTSVWDHNFVSNLRFAALLCQHDPAVKLPIGESECMPIGTIARNRRSADEREREWRNRRQSCVVKRCVIFHAARLSAVTMRRSELIGSVHPANRFHYRARGRKFPVGRSSPGLLSVEFIFIKDNSRVGEQCRLPNQLLVLKIYCARSTINY